jgi:glycosyltransferase involved in cell wall biosynthesis
MSEDLVSIIIPCYRQARFLPEAIACVRRQTYPRIELVIVNDGSDDDTDDVIARQGNGIVYIKQSNAGVCAARNTGAAKSTGKYLMFMDADDLLHPEAIQWHMQAMDGREDRLGVMGLRLFDSDPNRGEERHFPIGVPALPRLFDDNLAPPHAFLCSRKMFDRAGGFEVDRIFWGAEDWDLWLRMSLAGCDLATVEQIGAYYRRYNGSASTNLERAERATAIMLARTIQQIENDPKLRLQWCYEIPKIRARIALAYFDVGYHAAVRGAGIRAMAAYLRSVQWGYPIGSSFLGMVKAVAHAARARVSARVAPPSPQAIAKTSSSLQ